MASAWRRWAGRRGRWRGRTRRRRSPAGSRRWRGARRGACRARRIAGGRPGVIFTEFTDLSRVHFVGIGGAGMSGIAEILLEYELEVSGCDQAASEVTDRLRTLGARIHEGHSPDHLTDVELV